MNIERLVEVLEETGVNVFGDDIKEEEVMTNPSFFLYRDTNDYSRGGTGRSLIRKFLVQFVTKENKVINLEELIPKIQTAGLYFVNSYEDLGKIQGTDNQALMITMEFNYQVKKCMI